MAQRFQPPDPNPRPPAEWVSVPARQQRIPADNPASVYRF